MSLFDKGIVLPQKIAAALRMKPSELRKQMEEAKANDFMGLLTPPSFMQQKEMAEINAKNAEKAAKMNIDAQKENAKIAADAATKAAENKAGGSGSGAGRPQKKATDLTDEGASTRAGGQNIARGGKI